MEVTIYQRSHVILILGSGLTGKAIYGELSNRFRPIIHPVTIDWGQDESKGLQNVFHEFSRVISKSYEKYIVEPKVHVIWAAGSSNYFSTEVETKNELEFFVDCLKRTTNLVIALLNDLANFHLLSSIGGLFPDGNLVSTGTTPSPMQPYGHLKLFEEKILSRYNSTITSFVYRLSSVYGFVKPLQRKGLIQTFIENSVLNRTTLIFGSTHTLRDFVWAPDVARFVVRSIEHGQPPDGPILLASGKSETIENIKRLIEFALRRKLYSQYAYKTTNYTDICVSADALPDGWTPSYVTTNIPQIVANYRLCKL